jgi:hypothetical protein
MAKDQVIANFFWHGPRLGLYERACLTSFVIAGLTTRLYSFDPKIEVPQGVEVMDASALAQESEVFAYTQGGKKGSIAAFSDVFRYRLLQLAPGWWFDTDIYCLQGPESFLALERTSRGILIGEQGRNDLNAAVLYISDTDIARELEQQAVAKGHVFGWGAIGPDLVRKYVAANPERATVVGPSAFYPIHYRKTDKFYRPETREECEGLARDAVCVHLWNEILRIWHIPQNVMPCEGSYLHALFAATGVKVDEQAALPYNSYASLSQISQFGLAVLKRVNAARGVKERLREILSPR